MDQLGGRLHVHLLEKPRSVGGDGGNAEGEMLGDFRYGFSFADEAQNFVLAFREAFMRFGFA